jgi:hypothetical protein
VGVQVEYLERCLSTATAHLLKAENAARQPKSVDDVVTMKVDGPRMVKSPVIFDNRDIGIRFPH